MLGARGEEDQAPLIPILQSGLQKLAVGPGGRSCPNSLLEYGVMAEIDWAAIRDQALKDFSTAVLPPAFKIPALPHAVALFVDKSNDPKTTVKQLAQIIETDSGLTLELLRHVNSSYVGLRHKASSVQQTLSLLGMRQSKMFVITQGMQSAVRARKSKLINQACFWNASLQKALFAREVARMLRTDMDIAFAGALLQDYLLPVITNDLFEEYLKFVYHREDVPARLCEYEQQAFGWDHALGGACIAHRWHLPDPLVVCILYHHLGLKVLSHPQLGRSPVAAVALSALLPDQMRQDPSGLDLLIKLQEKWKAFNLETLAQRVDEMQVELGMGVRNDYPLLRRCRPAQGGAHFNDGMLLAS